MTDSQALREIVADLFDTTPAAIDADFSLRHPRLQTSAGRGVLAAAIHKRLGIYSARVFTVTRFDDLEAAVLGTNIADNTRASSHTVALASDVEKTAAAAEPLLPAPSLSSGIRVGVDVEMVESMPEAADFWSEPFYAVHFTPGEIAYCVRQEHPRMHFAARWCAKEALIKCDARFADVDPRGVQVSVRSDGGPVLEQIASGRVQPLDYALSLSHTPLFAVAIVASGVRPG